MSDISSEREKLHGDATHLEQVAETVFNDRTYYLGDWSDLGPSPSPVYANAQKLYDTHFPMSGETIISLTKADLLSGILSEVILQNATDYNLQEQGQEKQQDLGNKLRDAKGHVHESVMPHLAAARDLMRELRKDFEELLDFMEISEQGFRGRSQELREEAEKL